jgi:hypothetical protein
MKRLANSKNNFYKEEQSASLNLPPGFLGNIDSSSRQTQNDGGLQSGCMFFLLNPIEGDLDPLTLAQMEKKEPKKENLFSLYALTGLPLVTQAIHETAIPPIPLLGPGHALPKATPPTDIVSEAQANAALDEIFGLTPDKNELPAGFERLIQEAMKNQDTSAPPIPFVSFASLGGGDNGIPLMLPQGDLNGRATNTSMTSPDHHSNHNPFERLASEPKEEPSIKYPHSYPKEPMPSKPNPFARLGTGKDSPLFLDK